MTFLKFFFETRLSMKKTFDTIKWYTNYLSR